MTLIFLAHKPWSVKMLENIPPSLKEKKKRKGTKLKIHCKRKEKKKESHLVFLKHPINIWVFSDESLDLFSISYKSDDLVSETLPFKWLHSFHSELISSTIGLWGFICCFISFSLQQALLSSSTLSFMPLFWVFKSIKGQAAVVCFLIWALHCVLLVWRSTKSQSLGRTFRERKTYIIKWSEALKPCSVTILASRLQGFKSTYL